MKKLLLNKKYMKYNISKFLFIFIVFSFSCTDFNNESIKTNNQDLESSSNSLNAIVVPTPFQVAAVMNFLNIDYSSELFVKTDFSKIESKKSQALLLGNYIVRSGYFALYEKNEEAIYNFNQCKKLIESLGVNTLKMPIIEERINNNINNKDSLKVILYEYQNEFEEIIKLADEKNFGMHILSGMYIEGLYVILKNIQNKKSWNNLGYSDKIKLKFLLLEHQNFSENLIRLFELKNPEETNLIKELNNLFVSFESLGLNYTYDLSSKKVTSVKMRTTGLDELIEQVVFFKDKINNNNFF